MYSSAFYIFAVTLPILVASIFSIIYIELWYQIKMFCVELIIIDVTIVALMIIELFKIKKHIFRK